MGKAQIAAREPIQVELKKGKTYAWCACGLSSTQPFCDGSHKKGDLRPHVFKAAKSESVWLCRCKHTKDAPYCDGTHHHV